MKEANNEQTLIGRSMRLVVLLSIIYALAGNAFFYISYYNVGIVEYSYLIAVFLMVAFAAPIIRFFRNSHWYFPIFIFLFWIPFSVLFAFVLSKLLKLSLYDYDFGLLLVYFLVLNVMITVLGITLGIVVNGITVIWAKYKGKSAKV